MGPRARLAAAFVAAVGAAGAAAAAPLVVVVPVRGMIHSASAEVVLEGLAEAAARRAALVVLELDTPGGYLSTTEELQEALLASPVPVAVLVAPSGASAASAGFFLLVTADVAAMAPGTTAGSAHPVAVLGGGEGQEGQPSVAERKLEHHAAARMRTIAERRGRNPAEAERAVRESVSFTDAEALARGLVEHVVADSAALVRALDGRAVARFDGSRATLHLRDAVLERRALTLRQRVLAVVALPQIAYLLLLLGVVGLYAEVTHPGLLLPGVVGGVSLLLALYATTVLTVRAAGLLLLLLALALLLLEVKVTSYGVLGAGGVVALVVGSLLLFEGPMPGVELRLGWILPAALVVAAILVALATVVLRARRAPHVTGREGLLETRGRALTDIGPEGGRAFVQGEYWSATSASRIPAGSDVRVAAVHDLELVVDPAEPAPGAAGARCA